MMPWLADYWDTPIELTPGPLKEALLHKIRAHVKLMQPAWRHRWPHSLSAIKKITRQITTTNTWRQWFMGALQILGPLEWQDDLIARVTDALIAVRLAALQATVAKKIQVTLWNVNGVNTKPSAGLCEKLNFISRATQDNITVLTETKWSPGEEGRIMQSSGGIQVYSTSATSTEAGGKSGGVAILIPTHKWKAHWKLDLIYEGYAIAITSELSEDKVTIIAVYAQPGRECEIMKSVADWVSALPLAQTIIMAGDFNQAPMLYTKWTQWLLENLLVDITPVHLPTFWTGGLRKATTLDRYLVRHVGLEVGTHKIRIRASKLRLGRQEHAKVWATISPVDISPSHFPRAPVIPAKALTAQYPPSQELARRIVRIEEGCAQKRVDLIRATAWAWWREQPRSMFRQISTDIETLHKAAQQRGCYVRISTHAWLTLKKEVGSAFTEEEKWARAASTESDNYAKPCKDHGQIVVPRQTLIHLLDLLNLQRTQECTFKSNDSTIRKIHWVKGPSPIWSRLKAMDPKTLGTLSAMYDDSGKLQTGTAEVEAEVRSTRAFWLRPPAKLAPSLLSLLDDNYAQQSSFEAISPPTREGYQAVIIASKDTSPGIDGIPYALYRLVEPFTIDLLRDMLQDITLRRHSVRVPNPLLVWIPKAVAGPYPDCWRPLGMSTTFHRNLAGSIYYHIVATVKNLLHPSQALLNNFREPQHNFLTAHNFLH